MCKSQLLFYLLRVYFLRDVPFQKPGTTQDSETVSKQMASSGGSLWAQVVLLLKRLAGNFSHIAQQFLGIQTSVHTKLQREKGSIYSNPHHVFLSKAPAFLPEFPLLIYSLIPQPPASPCNSAQTYLKVSLRS